jgi:hypothetical protein
MGLKPCKLVKWIKIITQRPNQLAKTIVKEKVVNFVAYNNLSWSNSLRLSFVKYLRLLF